MWWERFGVAPVRPEEADAGWHRVDLTIRSLSLLERALKGAAGAGAVGWWAGPWQPTQKGHQATLSVYFAKRTHAKAFEANPPVSQRR